MSRFSRPMLTPGELAPWFHGMVLGGRPDFAMSATAGHLCLLFLMGSAGHPAIGATLQRIKARADLFSDAGARFFAVTSDTDDVASGRVAAGTPGMRYFIDQDRTIAREYGAAPDDGSSEYRPHLLLLDRRLQVMRRFTLAEVDAALDAVAAGERPTQQDWAPILSVPDLLEPEICDAMIALYDRQGGVASGFMREVDGKTTLVTDDRVKRRADATIEDPNLRNALVQRIRKRLAPAMQRTFHFEPTRIERYIVSAYDAEPGGYFAAHRDNTTKGTAHRRFAVTINLNDDYEGGDLRFPEFGDRTYRAPRGGAVVFSCSLLHEATPMTRGRRYACLPFLYDEAAAGIRSANNAFLADDNNRYAPSQAS